MAEATPDAQVGNDDSDDEALRLAIAMSLQEASTSRTPTPAVAAVAAAPAPPQSGTLPALDRKKMEEERLARLAKKRPRAQDDAVGLLPPSKKPTSTPDSKSGDAILPYTHGVVRRTWARGYPRTADDIKIEEVLQRDQLLLALLSSYQWDEEWLLSKVDVATTKLLLVAYAADDRQKQVMRANAPPHLKFCFPPMHGPGSMHSKLQVLKFPRYLRLVVPTGNLVPYDWGETGVMENMVFLIDLPRLQSVADHKSTPFSRSLDLFLRAMGVESKMVDSLTSYDFSKTADLGFVYTSPGGHMDESLNRVGYCGLGAAVTTLGLATTEPIEVDMASASLGYLKCGFVEALYNACQGDDGMREYGQRTTRKADDKQRRPRHWQQLKDRIRIYFPTNQTVSDSRGGKAAAGTICMQARWWRSPDFPVELVRDCVNTREGLLMHTKVIFVRRRSVGSGRPAWAYVGSANLSESAWGRVVKDKQSGKAKMSCRNWECGVVVPVGGAATATATAADLGVFHGTVPLPMKLPGRAYGPAEEPWFFDGA
ncbi:ubiquitin interaction domain-containing protein [Ophiocordyceps camponoti-floridani]|uniref:Ubiquitin interaction domain-containing protein n=1 Tax=Ophiocordyceps camponoti-floridani TaxID=2030778 RepID=A0A8H4Q2J2_9HYPO|nr:ubiquitin interaction domain-containing protein [Ophiocordyceps camponoti-floridani]